MEAQEESDLAQQRASKWALARLEARLSALQNAQHSEIIPVQASKLVPLLDIFQEDPQQLDPCLKLHLPWLVRHYLHLVQDKTFSEATSIVRTQSSDVAKVLSQLCKVRGTKVISRFLNNEPRFIEPILGAHDLICGDGDVGIGKSGFRSQVEDQAPERLPQKSWQDEFLLFLWLEHLMLTPFDLASISAQSTTSDPDNLPLGLKFEHSIPSVALRILRIALPAMSVADKRQSVAAKLLVRLVIRPDMQKIGLLHTTTQWALDRLEAAAQDQSLQIHDTVGLLVYLNGLAVSADISAIHRYLQRIMDQISLIADEDTRKTSAQSPSAVVKKIAIKIKRNLVIQLLNAPSSTDLDPMEMLEDVVDFLLRILKDRDTQVRKAASKALSIIASRVNADLAEEIVQAVLDSLNEDVLVEKGERSLRAVHALRWHGLVLTLAQMLFRRSAVPQQIPAILISLFSALDFEQRSSAGSSVGANVRDAANFGLWSLARRYTTAELMSVSIDQADKASIYREHESALQITACHLMSAACLDPAGNVRRGSSAALQELIGRHPDTIRHGISLVQIVDFQGVGLSKKAMVDISRDAACQDVLYREKLLYDLFSWRGIKSLDQIVRECAGAAIGKLSTLLNDAECIDLARRLSNQLKRSARTDFEVRHGTLAALSSLLKCSEGKLDQEILQELWLHFDTSLALTKQDFAAVSVRPALTAGAVMQFLGNLATLSAKMATGGERGISTAVLTQAKHIITLCLAYITEAHFDTVIRAVHAFPSFLDAAETSQLAQNWIDETRKPGAAYRAPALLIAIGAIWHALPSRQGDERNQILDVIRDIAKDAAEIEARVVALKSIGLVLTEEQNIAALTCLQAESIMDTLHRSLNDYTINERGDVGSLLRTEALTIFPKTQPLWNKTKSTFHCLCSCYRLAVEKLHKIRVQALQSLDCVDKQLAVLVPATGAINITDVSTYEYFRAFSDRLTRVYLAAFRTQDHDWLTGLKGGEEDFVLAVLQGFSSTAGAGPDDILQSARSALLDSLEDALAEADDGFANSTTDSLLALLRQNLGAERTLVPVLELLNFLLDAGILARLLDHSLKPDLAWAKLFANVQRAHYKSKSLPRLLVAVDLYRGLAGVSSIRADVMAKLTVMLAHPLPKVRVAAGEALWSMTSDAVLKPLTLAKVTATKTMMQDFQKRHCPQMQSDK